MANSSINLTSLDFDTLKGNLKTFMKSQTNFKDYDFEGSNMSVLLDVLAYNTYLNSFYLNMAISESFLDTAQIRDSVVSHAKELNYTPGSAKSPRALVNVTVTSNDNPTGIIEIPAGTTFSGYNANGTYIYTTDTNYVVSSVSNTFIFSNVAIYEGTYFTDSFYADYTVENQRFMLSNFNVDTDSISVSVVKDIGTKPVYYTKADKIYDLTPTSNVYFLQAAANSLYEIAFGDNVFGHYPENASLINITYRVTKGTEGGGINSFYLDKDLGPFNQCHTVATVETVSSSTNGSNLESIESIRFRAPRSYQTQDRAVTVNDYKTLIIDNFQDIKDVHIYGGQDVPGSTKYGTVFISPTTYSGSVLSSQRQQDLITFLNTKKIINIQNEIVNPDYVYIVPTINTTIDYNSTTLSPAQIKTIINNSITTYNTKYLQIFNNTLRYSDFLSYIDASDTSIVGSHVDFQLYKEITPTLIGNQTITSVFNNAIKPGSVTSTSFLTEDGNTYQLTDYNPNNDTFVRDTTSKTYKTINKNPIIYLKQISVNNNQSYKKVGTIDYSTGSITVQNLNVVSFLENPGIKVFVIPENVDISGVFNNIIEIDTSTININLVPKI